MSKVQVIWTAHHRSNSLTCVLSDAFGLSARLPFSGLPLGTVSEAAILDRDGSDEAGIRAKVFRNGLGRSVGFGDDAVDGSNLKNS